MLGVGFGLFASTSTSTAWAGHRACTGLPVDVEGLLRVEGLGAPVGEEVDTRERHELIQGSIPVIISAAHVLQPAPLLHHGDHGVPGQLGPQHLIVSLRVQRMLVSPDGPAQCVGVVYLDCCSIL